MKDQIKKISVLIKKIYRQDYEELGRKFGETLMDYFDVTPAKVNKRNNLMAHLKHLRKAERKARKALKTERMAELSIEKEKKRALDEQDQEIYEKEKLKKCEKFEIRDQFNWDELADEVQNDDDSS